MTVTERRTEKLFGSKPASEIDLSKLKKKAGLPGSLYEHPLVMEYEDKLHGLRAKRSEITSQRDTLIEKRELDLSEVNSEGFSLDDPEEAHNLVKLSRANRALSTIEKAIEEHEVQKDEIFRQAASEVVSEVIEKLRDPLYEEIVKHQEELIALLDKADLVRRLGESMELGDYGRHYIGHLFVPKNSHTGYHNERSDLEASTNAFRGKISS